MTDKNDKIELTVKDRQILESVGYTSLHKTKREALIKDQKNKLSNLSSWPQKEK